MDRGYGRVRAGRTFPASESAWSQPWIRPLRRGDYKGVVDEGVIEGGQIAVSLSSQREQ